MLLLLFVLFSLFSPASAKRFLISVKSIVFCLFVGSLLEKPNATSYGEYFNARFVNSLILFYILVKTLSRGKLSFSIFKIFPIVWLIISDSPLLIGLYGETNLCLILYFSQSYLKLSEIYCAPLSQTNSEGAPFFLIQLFSKIFSTFSLLFIENVVLC